MIFRLFLILAVSCQLAVFSHGQESYPKNENWDENHNSLLGEWAEPGGKFVEFGHQFPKSFNYTIENYIGSREIFALMFETLLDMDPITYEEVPGLAHKWEISDDKKEFTFHLDPKATWSDGKAITAEDVVWSFEAMKNPKHLTGQLQTIMSRLTKAEAIDEKTVKITANEVHWKNLIAASAFRILPKHWWSEQEFNEVHFEFPVVSGPFKISELKEPHYVRLQKRDDYWNADSPTMEGYLNFDEIEMRFYNTQETAFEAFKKRETDLFAVYTSSRWVKETKGERFDKNWIVKQKVFNRQPVGFQGMAMNMRRAPYNDKKVRKALAHLLDRERMNNDLMFNQYELLKNYYPDLYNKDTPSPTNQVDFDIDKARALLAEAGWKQNPDTGKLEKDGKPFVITFLTRDASTTKFLLIYEEALNDVGIDLKIDQKDMTSWAKDMDEYNYEMTWFPWGAIPLKDPEPMWHSKTKDIKQGSNITGFGMEKVDELIESTRDMFDVQARHDVVRQIDEILVEETPYILLWQSFNVRLLYWNKFGMPDHVLGPYEEEWAAKKYWWIDPDQEADLEDAIENKNPLPKVPDELHFDDVYEAPARTEKLQ